ncbi:MAG: retroviral-like aspartic protease [Anaerolineaceae bacterium]|nr:retroviral-like aspartic protease [Anaerolineaceae bacterium]
MTRFPYIAANDLPISLMPRLPLTLTYGGQSVEVVGLLDTGAAINVLPYHVGLTLGAVWEEQTTVVPLVGSLGQAESRALVVVASHSQITSGEGVRLVFAWTQLETAPVIFGQMNFFLEFDVCFYRSQSLFDVRLKDGG